MLIVIDISHLYNYNSII